MSALTQAGSTRQWRRLRLIVLTRDAYICRWCGAPATTVDHIAPRIHHGGDDLGNLVAACGPCNYSRGARVHSAARPSRNW